MNYCRQFIRNYALIIAHLNNLLKGETKRSQKKIFWTEESIEAFRKIKSVITEHTARQQPDFSKEFILTTDASEKGYGAILAQRDDKGKELMISAFSRTFDKCQNNYSVTDKELLAVIKGIENYRHYLLGKPFILRTDHKSLTYLWECKNPTSRLLRWSMKLQEFQFKIEYIKGESNAADSFSRSLDLKVDDIFAVSEDSLENKKEQILKEYHINSGHGSPQTMKFLLLQKYNWTSIIKDIEEFCKSCEICRKSGNAKVNTKNRVILSKSPNELWEVDLIGRIESKGKNKFIIVCIDHYSKWIETKVLENKQGNEIAKAIKELIIDKHGVPRRILSDNGLEFRNKEVKDLINRFEFKWEFNSPYHHETVGCVERVNQTLWNKIKKLSNFGRLSWERVVRKATLAVNISFHRALNTSPFVFKFCRLPILDIDKELSIINKKFSEESLKEQRDKNFQKYSKHIVKGKIQEKGDYNIGEEVLIFRKPNSNKLLANWECGYRILKKINEDAYIVANGRKEYRVNKAHIKKSYE